MGVLTCKEPVLQNSKYIGVTDIFVRNLTIIRDFIIAFAHRRNNHSNNTKRKKYL